MVGRETLRIHRGKPLVGLVYRFLKIREKKKYLKTHKLEDPVNVEATKALYEKDARWLEKINYFIHGFTLDVGSKYGLVTQKHNVVAFDINKAFLKVNVHTDKVLGDAHYLPFKPCIFERVVATEILEHLPNPYKAAQEMIRVLKPSGLIITTVPNRYAIFSEPTHINYFTERKLANLFNMDKVVCEPTPINHIIGVFQK